MHIEKIIQENNYINWWFLGMWLKRIYLKKIDGKSYICYSNKNDPKIFLNIILQFKCFSRYLPLCVEFLPNALIFDIYLWRIYGEN